MTNTVPPNQTELCVADPALDGDAGFNHRRTRRPSLLARRYAVELRQDVAWHKQAVVLAVSVAIGLAVCVAILMAAGVPAGDLFDEFVVATLGDADNFRAVLFQAAPTVMVGLAAALSFRARFWNLGLEGQMVWGAIGATAIALAGAGTPGTRLWLMGAAALSCGALWTVLPLVLRLRFGISEIISTLMLNYVAANLLLNLVYGQWKDPRDSFPHSRNFLAEERLPDIVNGYSCAILLAVLLSVAAWWFLHRSRAGIYVRFVNVNARAAQAMGIPVRNVVAGVVLLSGALAGFAGFTVTAGQAGRLTQDFYSGYGFSGILIAFLARNNPIAASVVALLIAVLFVTGRSLQVLYQIPFSMVQLIQAILVIVVAASDFFTRYRLSPVGTTE
ncbi:ABC transporter permease [Caballeronia concitans]|uniref:Ribose ABC transporter permease n=1 Tax=Caballeronia concitans TaxID=1777133 RepID=A0A658QZU5_9BURK|nr:ABC transporter permease [Caballeronia concitans]KIG10747.1 ABC-type transporter, integral membrane subunit [Burkholderia sp. MR1]SAL35987.1 ribose ABC transporter permease [Caballeronia concitans]